MSREILFRGQMRKKGEKVSLAGEPLEGIWIYGGIFAASNSDRCIITSYDDLKKYPVHADTVGQYTGLRDRNGTKIFEGDIVTYEHRNCPIVFEQRSDAAYFGIAIGPYETLPFGHYSDMQQIEIIGNIHDNPELLEVK